MCKQCVPGVHPRMPLGAPAYEARLLACHAFPPTTIPVSMQGTLYILCIGYTATFVVILPLSISLSLSHTHTHTHNPLYIESSGTCVCPSVPWPGCGSLCWEVIPLWEVISSQWYRHQGEKGLVVGRDLDFLIQASHTHTPPESCHPAHSCPLTPDRA